MAEDRHARPGPRAADGAGHGAVGTDRAQGADEGAGASSPYYHEGAPAPFQRLWTPHRMVYIGGENKPTDDSTDQCPFCWAPGAGDEEALIVHRGGTAYVLMNLYPYNTGHLLVCPYRHVSDWTRATAAERAEIGELTARAMEVIRHAANAHGFNLGMNQGQVAGAGIAAHLHQHIVPRWMGDANFMPITGRTKPVPQLLGDQRSMLADAWDTAPAPQSSTTRNTCSGPTDEA